MLNRPIMGGMAKALLKGYILVAPDSVITRRLVAGLERPFKMFEILLRTLPHYANASIALQERLNASQLAANVQVFLKLAETNSVVKRMLSAEMMTFKPLLERVFRAPSDPQSPSALLNRLAALLPPDVEDCFLTDRFRFVASEAEMEDTAICLQEESLYFSGLVFNNSDKNELAPYVSYKIRHNAKMVDDNDLWLQLPWNMEKRDRPLVDLKYYTFGFSFLQGKRSNGKRIGRGGIGQEPLIGGSRNHPFPAAFRKKPPRLSITSRFLVKKTGTMGQSCLVPTS